MNKQKKNSIKNGIYIKASSEKHLTRKRIIEDTDSDENTQSSDSEFEISKHYQKKFRKSNDKFNTDNSNKIHINRPNSSNSKIQIIDKGYNLRFMSNEFEEIDEKHISKISLNRRNSKIPTNSIKLNSIVPSGENISVMNEIKKSKEFINYEKFSEWNKFGKKNKIPMRKVEYGHTSTEFYNENSCLSSFNLPMNEELRDMILSLMNE